MNHVDARNDLRTLEAVLKKVQAIRRALATITESDDLKAACTLADQLDDAVGYIAGDIEIELDESMDHR